MKCCSKCREFKPHSDFWKDASRKDGYSRWCIICMKMFKNKQVHNVSDAALRTMRIKMCEEKIKFWQSELDKALNTKVEIIPKSVAISESLKLYHAKRKGIQIDKTETVEVKDIGLSVGAIRL